MNPLCIYHKNCIDGITAAWVVHKYFDGEVDLVPRNYGELPPSNIQGRNVLIVDFSFPKATLEFMASIAKSVLVLDHHVTAQVDLKDFTEPFETDDDIFPRSGVCAVFDMNRSGAGITWDYLNIDLKRPKIIDLVEDRDIWKFKLDGTKEFHEVFTSHDMNISTVNTFYYLLENKNDFDRVVSEGTTLLRKADQEIQRIISSTSRFILIAGENVPVANTPIHISEVGNRLCIDHPFAATYYDSSDGNRYFSLRSREGGMDVSQIAKRYGGGGHRNAAGFKAATDWFGD